MFLILLHFRYLQATKASTCHNTIGDPIENMTTKRPVTGIPSVRPITRSRAASSTASEDGAIAAGTRAQDAMLKHQV